MDTALVTVTDLVRTYGGTPGSRRGRTRRVAGRTGRVAGGARRGTAPFRAVDGVSFEAHRGELFALLGTNGAGKTSTLEVAEGLARPASGEVRVCGLDPYADRRVVRPRVGIMLQEAGFSSGMSVREAARMWAGTMSAPRPVDQALALADLRHRTDVAVQNLSGGERRRLDLALAIMGRPEVLFLDEPTTGLDPESRARTWDLIRGLLDGGTCIVLTTHYLEEAEKLADRIAIMHRGTIRRHGTLAEVVTGEPGRIEFVAEPALMTRLGDLPDLGLLDPVRQGERVVLTTHALQRDLARVLAWAGDVELPGLRANAASLEQVFLSIASEGESFAEGARGAVPVGAAA